MTLKTILTAAILLLTPGLAVAQCMGGYHSTQTAMSCAEGTMMDEETGRCIPLSIS